MQQSEILYFVALWKTYGLRFCAEMQWFVDIGYPLLDAEHSLCTAPWSGTPCPTTSAHSRTMSPLDSAWKPGFSPDTSVLSALETFVIIALYKSTFTIPYHTIKYHTTSDNCRSWRLVAWARQWPANRHLCLSVCYESVWTMNLA